MSIHQTILLFISCTLLLPFTSHAAMLQGDSPHGITIAVGEGTLTLDPLNDNAIRVRYHLSSVQLYPEDIVYTEEVATPHYEVREDEETIRLVMEQITAVYHRKSNTLSFLDNRGDVILREQDGGRLVEPDSLDDLTVYRVAQRFVSPPDEYLFGTGQFQDGYLNIRGLPRRLTQVNSQISIPFILSSKGYGLLWNNYGLTDFNPGESSRLPRQPWLTGRASHTTVRTVHVYSGSLRNGAIF